MSRIRRLAPRLSRGGLLGNTEGPEAYLRELDTLPSRFCRASGGTETVITQGGQFYRVHTYTDTDPTSLLLNFDGSNGSTTFTDDSGWGHAVTANGNAAISTTQSKFGGSSAYFDGTGDYLTVPHSAALSFGSGDFTIEGWVYLTSATDNAGFVGKRQAASFTGSDWRIAYSSATGELNWNDATLGATVYGTPAISLNTWTHIAFVRSGTTLYCFADGVLGDTGTVSANITNTNALGVGLNTTALTWPGYIDSLRITKGQALYTSAFTPPTTALARVGSGSLTFTRGGAVEYLVVGGGGGAGRSRGGGGGGGGFRAGAGLIANAGVSHTVSVGGGGAAGVSNGAATSGAESSLRTIASAGGGRGTDGGENINGIAGGSGGGAAATVTITGVLLGGAGNTPSTSPSQGSSGGNSADGTVNNKGAGGGGGASGVGQNGSGDAGGNGGDGTASSISGASVTYAGGGGGGSNDNALAGTGGSGGGGNGGASSNANGSDGTANTGGGGGGGRNHTVATSGGAGGSGIVVARYRITQAEYEAEAA